MAQHLEWRLSCFQIACARLSDSIEQTKSRRNKSSKVKIRRARLGKGGGGRPVSPQSPRVFRIFFSLNDFSPLPRSLEQASFQTVPV